MPPKFEQYQKKWWRWGQSDEWKRGVYLGFKQTSSTGTKGHGLKFTESVLSRRRVRAIKSASHTAKRPRGLAHPSNYIKFDRSAVGRIMLRLGHCIPIAAVRGPRLAHAVAVPARGIPHMATVSLADELVVTGAGGRTAVKRAYRLQEQRGARFGVLG
ncbi:hypothetical protein C8J57DRAFT_1256527 [Mycena rebaudengoi]|nr:hypothetical protein C8J57DRAFT_1256527 [Mycena rebaudengoi]